MRSSLLAAVLIVCAASPARAEFTATQIEAIVNLRDGAVTRTQYFYHAFKLERAAALAVPAWLDEDLPALSSTVWRDPDGGESFTAVQLWQGPPSVLYEFFERARGRFPPDQGGTAAARLPESRALDSKEFMAELDLMEEAVRRLRGAKLQSSLRGRGRPLIAIFKRTEPEIKAASLALGAGDDARFEKKVMAVAALMNEAWAVLNKPAPPKP